MTTIVSRKNTYRPPTEKACPECKEIKDIVEFPTNGLSANGLQRYSTKCKECTKDIACARRGGKRRGHFQVTPGERKCKNCHEIKPNEEFTQIGKDKDGNAYRNGTCRPCRQLIDYLRRYGIDREEYDSALKRQLGLCAICGNVNNSNRRLAIDHNHVTGQFRGLLCTNCNIGLGHLKADIGAELLEKAISYIKHA